MLAVLGDRNVAICRELTKINEEVLRTTLSDAADCETAPRGEYVIVVSGYAGEDPEKDEWWKGMSVSCHVKEYLSRGASKNEAIRKTAIDRGLSRNYVYKTLLAEKGE